MTVYHSPAVAAVARAVVDHCRAHRLAGTFRDDITIAYFRGALAAAAAVGDRELQSLTEANALVTCPRPYSEALRILEGCQEACGP